MPIDSSIRDLISKYGHISVDLLMKEALSSNSSSYYQQQSLIGAGGDFTTSPEISQLFGEIIGLWVIEKWRQLGTPKKINLVEMGPGRGLLMRDLLRVAKLMPEFYNSLQIQLVEINPNFIEWQQSNLSQFNLKIDWLTKIEDIAELPSIMIANEFFDALPIKQYIKVKELWYESIFIADPSDGKIRFDKIGLTKELQAQLLQDHPNAFDGAIVEESLSSLETIRFMLKHIKKFRGNALIIDYGYDVDPKIRARHQYYQRSRSANGRGFR